MEPIRTAPKPKRTRTTKVRHKGVQILPPSPQRGKHYCSLKWRDPETNRWRYQVIPGVSDPDKARPDAVRKAHELDVAKRAIAVHGRAAVVAITAECARYMREAGVAAKKGPNKGKPLTAITRKRYKAQLDAFEAWCGKRDLNVLSQLTRAQLSDYRSQLVDDELAVTTINFYLKPVRQMLLNARAGGRFDTLDSDAIRASLARFAEADPVPVCLSVMRIGHIFESASKVSARAGVVIALGLLGGLRRAEAANLKVSDFDPRAPSAYDPSATHPVLHVNGKTGPRVVELLPYSPWLVRILTALTEGRRPTEPLHGMSYDAMGELAQDIGIEYRHLRSTCASFMRPVPGDPERKADRLGHTLPVARKHYLALPLGTPSSAASLDRVMQCEDALRDLYHQIDRPIGLRVDLQGLDLHTL